MTVTHTEPIKGWKAFSVELKCRGMQYEVGKTYEHHGKAVLCESGFHFHHKANQIFNHYPNNGMTRVCEVVAHGAEVSDDKAVCTRLEVVRELSFFEICNLLGGNGNGNGYGYGDGYGYGYGNGDGDGDGYGYGYGNGDGDGDGYGDGYGYGYGYGDGNGNGYGYGDGDGSSRAYKLPDFIQFIEDQAA